MKKQVAGHKNKQTVKMLFYGLNIPECVQIYEVSMLVVDGTVVARYEHVC